MKNESSGENLAYFKDGHTEVITEYEILKDCSAVWFITDSGRFFAYMETYPECKFYEREFVDYDSWAETQYVAATDIEKIKICAMN